MAEHLHWRRFVRAAALLAALPATLFATDLEVVRSFNTLGLIMSPASIAVDGPRDLLLLGGSDGSIVEFTREGLLLEIVVPGGLLEGRYAPGDRALALISNLDLLYCAGGSFNEREIITWMHVYTRKGDRLGNCGSGFGRASVQGLVFEPRDPIGVLHMLDRSYSQIFSFTVNAAGDLAGTRYSYFITLPYDERLALRGFVLLPKEQYFLLALKQAQLLLVPVKNLSPGHGEMIVTEETGRIDLARLGIGAVDDLAYDPIRERLYLTDSSQDMVFELAFVPPAPFHRGDPDESGAMDLADAVYLLSFLFQGAPAPRCAESGDGNNDGRIDVSDAVFLLRVQFHYYAAIRHMDCSF